VGAHFGRKSGRRFRPLVQLRFCNNHPIKRDVIPYAQPTSTSMDGESGRLVRAARLRRAINILSRATKASIADTPI